MRVHSEKPPSRIPLPRNPAPRGRPREMGGSPHAGSGSRAGPHCPGLAGPGAPRAPSPAPPRPHPRSPADPADLGPDTPSWTPIPTRVRCGGRIRSRSASRRLRRRRSCCRGGAAGRGLAARPAPKLRTRPRTPAPARTPLPRPSKLATGQEPRGTRPGAPRGSPRWTPRGCARRTGTWRWFRETEAGTLSQEGSGPAGGGAAGQLKLLQGSDSGCAPPWAHKGRRARPVHRDTGAPRSPCPSAPEIRPACPDAPELPAPPIPASPAPRTPKPARPAPPAGSWRRRLVTAMAGRGGEGGG